jgi:hypothetical protein
MFKLVREVVRHLEDKVYDVRAVLLKRMLDGCSYTFELMSGLHTQGLEEIRRQDRQAYILPITPSRLRHNGELANNCQNLFMQYLSYYEDCVESPVQIPQLTNYVISKRSNGSIN